jgi:hypothetical protein
MMRIKGLLGWMIASGAKDRIVIIILDLILFLNILADRSHGEPEGNRKIQVRTFGLR